jgi:hypothetical protein
MNNLRAEEFLNSVQPLLDLNLIQNENDNYYINEEFSHKLLKIRI